ncbi:hypothetical protein BA895_16175 [Humibacillus sp. DSM 29435]|uniref:class II aldolase/adducin family protein n=1 Tax=Humibacillus sp. DSM 29435 TaxID=1869167 RepID=UPI000871B8CB|nr:class II aldolase/adducin family protein [Humibacillus sp. DSM 29435]OFE17329.1 hypothetical protein BA895_16175 [Humibacillus sp. DSM 29435]
MTGRLETAARRQLVELGQALYDRGITPGRTGNLSIRLGDRALMTPTGISLGRLDPDALAVVDIGGHRVAGPAPTKESALHLALYERFPDMAAVAHGHTTHAVAWSCLPEIDLTDALPVLTAYYAMRVGRLPVIPYAPPGDPALAASLRQTDTRCALLANHGSIAAGADLEAALDALEEIEETARIAFLLRGSAPRSLTPVQVSRLTG